MEKWKITVIAALILGLGGYGLFQQQSQGSPFPAPDASVSQTPGAAGAADNKAAIYIGHTLGDATLPEWSGVGPWQNTPQAITLNSLKGKPALIEFFRINCSHCQDAAPFLEQLYRRYQPRGLKMVAVQTPGNYKDPENEETKWDNVKAWAKAGGLTYPIAFDEKSRYFQQTINGKFYPTTMITDASGKVVYSHTGHDTDKTVQLAVELEKQFPGPGPLDQRARELSDFLQPFVLGAGNADADMLKALRADVLKRLQS